MFDDESKGMWAAANVFDQARRRDVTQVAGDAFRSVRFKQAADVGGVDPEEDQGLVERQGISKGIEHRAIEAHKGEAVEPLEPKRVQGERAAVVDHSECRAKVGRSLFEADEIEQDEKVVQVPWDRPPSGRQVP